MKKYAHLNGRIMPLERVKINPYDLGLMRGYGVFDVMRTENGKPFLIHEHFLRLERSAGELKLKLPFTEKAYAETVKKLLRLNGFKKSSIRTIITGGVSPDAFSVGKETALILIEEFKPLPSNVFKNGAKVITLDFQRADPRVKITNYVEAIKHQDKKKKAGALEILYVHDGKVLEFSTSNVLVVKDGKIIAPQKGILFGITRYIALKLAKENGFRIVERDVTEKELRSASEVILTATNKGIVPIVSVDGKKIGDGKPGPVTMKLMRLFDRFTKNY